MNRRILTLALLALSLTLRLKAQIISSDPLFPLAGEAVLIYFDATQGTAGLKDYTGDVYAHTGVLTNQSTSGSDWRYVKTDWEENSIDTKMTRISANLYSLEIGPSIRTYYGVPQAETISHMAFVFRSSDSKREGKDSNGANIYVRVYPDVFSVSIFQPESIRIMDPGETLEFRAAASSEAEITLRLNAEEIKTVHAEEISHDFVFQDTGDYWIRIDAEKDGEIAADSVFVHVKGAQPLAALPAGMKDGINYLDEQSLTLVLYAPLKEHVFVIGDFNAWTPNTASRMKRDGDHYWITLDKLAAGEQYGYQYLIDGDLRLADPYTAMTLDPEDKWIPEATYPDLKVYPSGRTTGIVSVLEPGKTAYVWEHEEFSPPDKDQLVIYELLLRDFLEAHDWQTLSDTLDYFTGLGINAIELMPVNEFEGNESWGYNPSFYFAPDKYYGPANDLKVFIDSCHGRGIAVIIDMVLNHSYSESPLVQMYFENGQVSSDNPWFNVESPNQTYSWGYDFNHESPDTRNFIDRVNTYWLDSFRVDGFRFDFTKGFTNTPGEGWSYDPSRISILKRMADVIWDRDPQAYVILEHLTNNTEEKELAHYGFLLWGNMNKPYSEAAMAYHENKKSDFSGISYLYRLWDYPHLVGYMESHDEERMMFKNRQYGASSSEYDVRDFYTALRRMELAGTFFFTVPGPKMIWQFGELGYDYSIDYDCRVCNKPIRWNYWEKGARKRVYQVWASLIHLKLSEAAFRSRDFQLDVQGAMKRIEINHSDMDIRILGNFDVIRQDILPSFSREGWWYDFFEGDSLLVSDPLEKLSLQPGEYRLYTSKRLRKPDIVSDILEPLTPSAAAVQVFPNPGSGILRIDPLPEPSTLNIFNPAGQVILVLELQSGQAELDLSSLSPGIYFLQQISGKQRPRFARIIRE